MSDTMGYLLVTLTAASIIANLPSSRRIRLILAIVTVPLIILSYQQSEVRALYEGAANMDAFIKRSERLLNEGKADVLLAAYREYQRRHDGRIPKGADAAFRVRRLDGILKQQEYLHQQQSKQ